MNTRPRLSGLPTGSAGVAPELVARRCAWELREALRRAGRVSLRFAADLDGLRFTLGAKAAPARPAEPDLPGALRDVRPSHRTVYRIVRDLRAADPGRLIEARHVHAEYERREGEFVGASTVYHALCELRRAGLLAKRPRAGWIEGEVKS